MEDVKRDHLYRGSFGAVAGKALQEAAAQQQSHIDRPVLSASAETMVMLTEQMQAAVTRLENVVAGPMLESGTTEKPREATGINDVLVDCGMRIAQCSSRIQQITHQIGGR